MSSRDFEKKKNNLSSCSYKEHQVFDTLLKLLISCCFMNNLAFLHNMATYIYVDTPFTLYQIHCIYIGPYFQTSNEMEAYTSSLTLSIDPPQNALETHLRLIHRFRDCFFLISTALG